MLQKYLHSFKTHKDRHALCINDCFYSYKTLSEKINVISSEIQKQNISGKIVGIITYNDLETYASIFACWFSGCGFVPVNPKNPIDRNNEILNQVKAPLILSSHKELSGIIETTYKVIHTPDINEKSIDVNVSAVLNDTVLCILFTSGSTGIPKGVPMTKRNIESTLDSFFSLNFQLNENDRFLQMFDFTFDMSLLSYLPALLIGACVYTVSDDKIRYLAALKTMQKYNITFAAMVPSTLTFLRPYFEKIQLENLKYSVLGGEPFHTEIAREWASCVPYAKIINISGPTEITMACMGYELSKEFDNNKHYNGILSFGKPWKNTLAIVIDEDLRPVETGIQGELCFSGEHVMSGYWNNAAKNKEVIVDIEVNGTKTKFYRTGDMAFVDKDGDFMSCGRKDYQVKIQGHKVELGEIEQHVRNLTKTLNTCAISFIDDTGFTSIHLFAEKSTYSSEAILQYLKSKVPAYMIPSGITLLETFPVNQNGKIDRIALSNML